MTIALTATLRKVTMVLVAASLVACGSGDGGGGTPVGFDLGATDGPQFHPLMDAASGHDTGAAGSDVAPIDRSMPATGPVLIYAHTDKTLYQVDATQSPFALTKIGDFSCIGGHNQDPAMTDLAVDKAGNLTGITERHVYPLTIQGAAVSCGAAVALQGSAKYFGLTYVPEGVLGATETLVAANSAGELWALDNQGGQTQVGIFGAVPAADPQGNTYQNAGANWELSGDLVFLYNNGDPVGFATVRDCANPPSTSSCSSVDTLIEIDLTMLRMGNTGSVTKAVRGQILPGTGCANGGSTQFGSFFGIAAYQDKVYGFSRKGDVVQIDNSDGTGCLLQSDSSMPFAGAATTTLAPVIRPRPEG